ncbi:MAG: chain length determinant protein, partial [Proteobacteria bacterium]|nr:chain length determinant protein [Pseudomonadota bacterium]
QMNSTNTRPYIATQKELITDYSVVGPVVDRLGLTTDPIMISAYGKRPKGDQRDMRRWVAQFIMDRTRVENLDGSNILEITYAGPTPAQAKSVADMLREAYIDATLASRRQQADKNADWFLVQADKVKAQLDQAQAASADYQRQNNIVLQDDKSDVESARLRSLAAQTGGGAMIAPSSGASPSSLELAQVDAQITQLSKTLGPNHPELIALKARRAALQTAVDGERNAQKAAMAAAAGAGAGAVERAMSEQKAKVMANQDKIARALQLQATVAMLQQQYDKTASRAAELKQQAATVETGLTPLGNAVTPSAPSFPKVPLIMIGSLVLGLGGGVLMSLLVEFFARRVRCI